MKAEEVAGLIDHTILGAEATEADIRDKCREAKEHEFASVCVNPGFVDVVKEELQDTPVKVCTVIGFPLGATRTEVKAYEAKQALKAGAQELDMVINVGAVKSGAWEKVTEDIAQVVNAADGNLVKVIIETCYLTTEEKKKACQAAKEAGADFVKTSTGFGSGGAKVEDVKLMKEVVGEEMGVKASGGIGSLEDAQEMIAAGASRIGASSGVEIVTGGQSEGSY